MDLLKRLIHKGDTLQFYYNENLHLKMMIEQHQTLFKHNELPKCSTDTQCTITDDRGNLCVNNVMCQQMKKNQEELQELNEKDKN